MKIAIIDIGWKELTTDSLQKEALGGSETWLMQITKEFSLSSDVEKIDVFCNTPGEKTDKNITFIPLYNLIDKFIERPHYEFVILNRIIHRFGANMIALIRQYNITENIFIQMHDLSLLYEDHLIRKEEMDLSCLHDPRVRGFVFLTPWHAKNFFSQYPELSDLNYYVIPNGVNDALVPDKPKTCDHHVLWSSCVERGLDILIRDVAPRVRAGVQSVPGIPDFEVDVAGYGDSIQQYQGLEHVNILGKLDKQTLYKEMSKHAVWFYPGTFAETFCITMVENMLCKNVVVSPFTYGTQDILPDELKMKESLIHATFETTNSYEYYNACNQAAVSIINAINFYDKYDTGSVREYVKRYNWKATAEKYLSIYKDLYYLNVPVKKHLKGVFLSMSCNKPFFIEESKLVEQTWAKSLIEGQHPGYEYYRYTSCDEQHPEECIDGTTIYVKSGDGLYDTYDKMRRVYHLLLRSGITFDKILRTNTSTFINVPRTIQFMESLQDTDLGGNVCGYYHKYANGQLVFQFNTICGNMYVMSKYVADRVFLSNFNQANSDVKVQDGDDIITAYIINEIFNMHINIVPDELHFVNLNTVNDPDYFYSGSYIPRYKWTLPGQEMTKDQIDQYVDDPELVNHVPAISVRTATSNFDERINKYHEFDHMKELYEHYTL